MKRGLAWRMVGAVLLVAALALSFAAYTQPDFVFGLMNQWALCT